MWMRLGLEEGVADENDEEEGFLLISGRRTSKGEEAEEKRLAEP